MAAHEGGQPPTSFRLKPPAPTGRDSKIRRTTFRLSLRAVPGMNDLLHWVTPFRYLTVAGALLVVLGVAGLTGLLARVSSRAFFRPPYWINAVHAAFGCVLFVLAFVAAPSVQTTLVLVGAILGLSLGSSGLLLGPLAARRFNKPELADRSDHLAHLIVGVLAFWAWSNGNLA